MLLGIRRSLAATGTTACLLVAACASDGESVQTSLPLAEGRPLTLGVLAPLTGEAASTDTRAIPDSVQFAIDEANAAGGINGAPVSTVVGDTGTDPLVAKNSVDRFLEVEHVQAVIGAYLSRISLAVVGDITGAGVVQCSGGNTSSQLSTIDDGGLYFRSIASDALRGAPFAERMLADGHQRAAIVAENDAYGTGLADAFATAFTEKGGQVVARVDYDPTAPVTDATLAPVTEAAPDAVLMVALAGAAGQISDVLLAKAMVPSAGVGLYIPAPSTMSALAGSPAGQAGLLDGALSVIQIPFDPPAKARFDVARPDLAGSFNGPSYDCAAVVMLAAATAGSNDPADFAPLMVDVTRGGTKCTGIAECLRLVEAGVDIDYDGAAGKADWSDIGEPATAEFETQVISGGQVRPSG